MPVLSSDSARMKLEKNLNYSFNDKSLLGLVLTSPSSYTRRDVKRPKHFFSFNQLQFLGIRVLDLLISHLMFLTRPFASANKLTRAKTGILKTHGSIIKAARRIQLPDALIAGEHALKQPIKDNKPLLLTHMKALFGAMWLDSDRNYRLIQECFIKIFLLKPTELIPNYRVKMPISVIPPFYFLSLQKKLGYYFNQPDFLSSVFVKKSALTDYNDYLKTNFQALEFLGDRVFNCVISDWILSQYTLFSCNKLSSTLFQVLANNRNLLPNIAKTIQLNDYLITNLRQEQTVILSTKSLADHTEALIAAIWLDVTSHYNKIYPIIANLIESQLVQNLRDNRQLNQSVVKEAQFSDWLNENTVNKMNQLKKNAASTEPENRHLPYSLCVKQFSFKEIRQLLF